MPETGAACGWPAASVAGAAPQVVTEMLEPHGVEAEQAAYRLAAQRPVAAGLDGMPPLLRHPLRTP
jgi:hypothetical protein